MFFFCKTLLLLPINFLVKHCCSELNKIPVEVQSTNHTEFIDKTQMSRGIIDFVWIVYFILDNTT